MNSRTSKAHWPAAGWVAMLVLVAGQLMALYQVCDQQVRRAQARHLANAQQRQIDGCEQPVAPSLAEPCLRSAQYARPFYALWR